jgi:PKHD-type hydroxylase
MILNYSYFYFISALPESLCDSIIETGLEKMSEAKNNYGQSSIEATTGDWRAKSEMGNDAKLGADVTLEDATSDGSSPEQIAVRDSEVSWIDDTYLYEAIWPYIREANKQAGWNFDWDFTEDMQFTKYGLNQFYGWHADCGVDPYVEFNPEIHKYKYDKEGNPVLNMFGEHLPHDSHVTDNPNMIGKIRKLSVTVSLSDPNDYVGGNLKFDLGPHRPDRYHECEEIRPRGSIIVFPSHVYHQVTPVTSGTRYSLVNWSLGKPWK